MSLAVLAALLPLLSACNSSDQLGDGPDVAADAAADVKPEVTPGMSLADACDDIAATLCAPLGVCCDVQRLRYDSSADCAAALRADCLANRDDAAQAIAAGVADVDPVGVAVCVQALQRAGDRCRALGATAIAAVCAGVVRDRAALLAVCASGVAGLPCAGGAGVCAVDAATVRCVAPAGEGDACEAVACAKGLHCVADGAGVARCATTGGDGARCGEDVDCGDARICHHTRCRAPTAAAAQGGGPGVDCDVDADCGAGLFCHSVQLGACVSKGAVGTPCSDHNGCGDALACDPKAQSCVVRPGAGQACVNGACKLGLGCDAVDQTCVALPSEASACLASTTPCGDGLGCVAGVCAVPGGQGAACDSHDDCGDGLGCDVSGKACVALPGVGASCLGEACGADAFCGDDGLCAPLRAKGALCPTGRGCSHSLVCTIQSDGLRHCAPAPKIGQQCSFDCAEGLYCQPQASEGRCRRTLCALHGT